MSLRYEVRKNPGGSGYLIYKDGKAGYGAFKQLRPASNRVIHLNQTDTYTPPLGRHKIGAVTVVTAPKGHFRKEYGVWLQVGGKKTKLSRKDAAHLVRSLRQAVNKVRRTSNWA